MANQDFFDDLKSSAKDFGSRVNKFFDNIVNGNEDNEYPAAADVVELGDRVVFALDLPGFEKSDVTVQIRDNQLVIKGQRKPTYETDVTYHVRERAFGPFERSFTIPPGVEQEQVKAKFENGILRVTLPKEAIEEADTSSVKID